MFASWGPAALRSFRLPLLKDEVLEGPDNTVTQHHTVLNYTITAPAQVWYAGQPREDWVSFDTQHLNSVEENLEEK